MLKLLWVTIVSLFSLQVSAMSTSEPTSSVSFENMAVNADVVAIVYFISGEIVDGSFPKAYYKATLVRIIGGSVGKTLCIEGPAGLRIGSRYLIFIQNKGAYKHGGKGCEASYNIGDRVPRALETFASKSGVDYVKLDNERIAYPKFVDSFPVQQVVSDGNESTSIVLGSWAPLSSVVDFVSRVREGGVH